MTRKAAKAEKWADRPLVPVRGPWVRAVLARLGLSMREAASQLKKQAGVTVKPQTLNYITSDPQKQMKCRKDVLVGIAHLAEGMGITVEWLTGETDRLPFVPDPNSTALDLFGQGFRWMVPMEGAQPPKGTDDPPEVQLALNGFLAECFHALTRDLSEVYEWDALDQYRAWGHELLLVLFHLTNNRLWQNVAIARRETEYLPKIALPLIESWRQLLSPWFDNKRREQPNWPHILDTLRSIGGPEWLDYDGLKKKARTLTPNKRKAATLKRRDR